MAELRFPWEAYMAAQQQKNQNQQNMNQNIAGLGQGLGQIGQDVGLIYQQQKQKELMDQLMAASRGQGALQQGPQMPTGPAIQGPSGYAPPGNHPSAVRAGQYPMPQNPTSGMGAPAQDNTSVINSLLMQLAPKESMERMLPPTALQQSEITKNNAMAQRAKNMTGKPTATVYRNSVTGEMTDDPSVAVGPEWKAYQTSQGDVLGKLAGQNSANQRNTNQKARTEAWNRSIDAKQINELTKKVGLTERQRSALQSNNLRGFRAQQILETGPITYQQLALGEIDLTGIMQGGVPHVDEMKAVHFPGWQEEWAKWRTYAEGHPQEMVPEDIRKKVLGLVKGVIEIDNKFIGANANFSKGMLAPTIRGGLGNSAPIIDQMTKTMTSGGADDFSKMSDAELRNIAGRR